MFQFLLVFLIGLIITNIICWKLLYSKVYLSPVDIRFHLNRFQGLTNVFNSPVNFHTFSGQGKAVSIFYPWYFIYPFKIINMITHSYVVSYKVYNFLLIFIATQVSFFVTNSFVKNKLWSIVISCVYMLSPTTSIYLYSLAANGQLLAIIITPIAIIGIIQLFFYDYKKWYIFVIAIALFSLGHIASILLYFIISVCAFLISLVFSKFSIQRLIHVLIAGLFSIVFIVLSLLPIFEQRISYDLFMPPNLEIGSRAYKLIDYFRLTIVNRSLSNVGIITLVGLITIIFMFRKFELWQKLLSILTFILVILMSNVFPWKFFENSFLGQIQDTHRFMLPFIYCTLLVFITFLFKYLNKFNKLIRVSSASIFIFLAMIIFIGFAFKVVPVKSNNILAKMSLDDKSIVSYHSPDYENNNDIVKKVLKETKYTKVYHVKRSFDYKINNQITNDIVKKTDDKISINVNIKEKSILMTPLSVYKGINISINSVKTNQALVNKHTGTLYFNLNKGVYHINIWYKYTKLYRFCQISLILFLFVFVIAIWKYKVKYYALFAPTL